MNAISPSQLWKKRLGDWVLNPYVGCEHGCLHCYCPAMPGVKFFNKGHSQQDWGSYIFPKVGFVEALKRQLRTFTPAKAKRTEWGDGWLLMSFLTDCYTPIEAKEKITRECLKLLLEAGHKVRDPNAIGPDRADFDILVAHRDRVLVGTSLPYLDDSLARVLEPRASGPRRRLQMLSNAVEAGLEVFVAIAPFMPWDNWRRLQEVCLQVSHGLNPREMFCEVLNPKGENIMMMQRALQQAEAPAPAQLMFQAELRGLAIYDMPSWAQQTAGILRYGHINFPAFIPWPDTRRGWAKHLPAESALWLNQFLPNEEMERVAA